MDMGGPTLRYPGKDDLLAARGLGLPDVIAWGLKVLFCGINPGLYSAAVGHHFARPGNRFWTALFRAGLTDRLLSPSDENLLPGFGYGVTNIVNSATAQASELSTKELQAGAELLKRKVWSFQPRILGILGVDAYRKAFQRKTATIGCQREKIGHTRLWVLPNPSGINAHYQVEDLIRLLSEIRTVTEEQPQ